MRRPPLYSLPPFFMSHMMRMPITGFSLSSPVHALHVGLSFGAGGEKTFSIWPLRTPLLSVITTIDLASPVLSS
jgi:hypothetical protein